VNIPGASRPLELRTRTLAGHWEEEPDMVSRNRWIMVAAAVLAVVVVVLLVMYGGGNGGGGGTGGGGY